MRCVCVCVGGESFQHPSTDLAAEVDDASVRVKKWQEDPAASVELLQGQRLPEVLLYEESKITLSVNVICDGRKVCSCRL